MIPMLSDVGLVCLALVTFKLSFPNLAKTWHYLSWRQQITLRYQALLEEAQCGLWAYSGDREEFKEQVWFYVQIEIEN